MNGGRNYNGPKVHSRALVKSNYMRETPQQPGGTRRKKGGSKNPPDMGTIRREGFHMNDEMLEEPSETLRSISASSRLEAQWVVGFVDGEGCFYVGINPQPEMKTGYQVLPEFVVVQHARDIQVLYALKQFFGCGVVRRTHGERMAYRVRGLKNLWERIVPFFEKHPLKTRKRQDFLKFRRILMMMKRNEHLTLEGIEKIRQIASRMNTGRERESPAPLETERE